MNSILLQKNLACLKSDFSVKIQNANLPVELQKSKTGEWTLELEGKWIHSRFDPITEAKRFAEELPDDGSQRVYLLFGAGLGQIKELGMNLFTEFYVHDFTKETIAIPNAAGETIAIFGLFGFFIRFAVIIYLFFKTRVFTNYYRLGMFIFIFIYQFTGSYITNIAEYIIWIIALTPGFAEFDKTAIHKNQKNSLTVS